MLVAGGWYSTYVGTWLFLDEFLMLLRLDDCNIVLMNFTWSHMM